ncbi:hypothetical protein AAHA92_05736 [Salvia divinorum]|uniref:Uncharacterized protein n=1 Tax=Salvia divinorum TaxID=28513 RepID=A0ABD1I5J6_SALDI
MKERANQAKILEDVMSSYQQDNKWNCEKWAGCGEILGLKWIKHTSDSSNSMLVGPQAQRGLATGGGPVGDRFPFVSLCINQVEQSSFHKTSYIR